MNDNTPSMTNEKKRIMSAGGKNKTNSYEDLLIGKYLEQIQQTE